MSEGKARRVDYSPDEYVSGVGGLLRADEQGVYWMVCTLIMSEGGAIPYNERRLAALCLLRPSQLRKIIDALVSMGKLDLTEDGKLSQKRSINEVEKSLKRIQSAQENGSKGGRPSGKGKQKQQQGKAVGSDGEKLTTNYQPPTIQEEKQASCPKPPKRRRSYPEKFEAYWREYPTDPLMSKADAAKAFEKLDDDDQDAAITSLPAFNAYCRSHPDYRPVHANRYITGRRFDGFNKQAEATAARQFVAMGSDTWSAILKHRGVSSMPFKEHQGKRGWWFGRDEIDEATKRVPA